MSFESFVDMIQRKALAFFPIYTWEDPYEGFLFKAIKTKSGSDRILQILREIAPKYAMPNWITLHKFVRSSFCQSWTECPESDALWRIYAQNKTYVSIENTKDSISQLSRVSYHKVE